MAIQAFENHSRGGALYARNTLAAYQSDLFRFAEFITRTLSHTATLADFTIPALEAFIRSEITAGFNSHTLARRLASLKAFNQFLQGPVTNWEKISKLILSSQPEAPAPITPYSLETVHLGALWNVMEHASQARAIRDQALLALLLETGLPVQRALALNLSDLRSEARILMLVQPSGRQEAIALEWAARPLRRYLKEGRPELSHQPDEPALWISQAGNRMTRQAVWHAIRGWGRRAGLPFSLSPRLLSQTAARRLVDTGMPLQQIQLRLGHQSSLSTLARLRRITA